MTRKELKEYNDLVNEYNELYKENKQLKKQLEYLRSGEYYNQLRFERDMLQNVVDNGEVSKEDKEFIDMTHRNTELLEENQKLKKQLEDTNEELELVRCDLHNRTSERDGYYRNIEMLENQQKDFIEYLEDLIKQNETVVEVSKYGLPKNCSKLLIDFYKEILSKYKEIIGGKE